MRVFSGEPARQCHRQTSSAVARGHCLGEREVAGEIRGERAWNGDHAIFSSLGTSEDDPGLREGDILDSEIERFTDAQAAAVKKMDNQSSRIATKIADGGEQGSDLVRLWCVPDTRWFFGAQGIDRP